MLFRKPAVPVLLFINWPCCTHCPGCVGTRAATCTSILELSVSWEGWTDFCFKTKKLNELYLYHLIFLCIGECKTSFFSIQKKKKNNVLYFLIQTPQIQLRRQHFYVRSFDNDFVFPFNFFNRCFYFCLHWHFFLLWNKG